MKKSLIIGLATILGSVPAFAEEVVAAAAGSGQSGMIALGAGFAIGFAAQGGAIGQALIGSKAMEGIARNPESSGKVTVTLLIGLALIESLCIYALVIALIIIFAHPQAGAIAGLFAGGQ